MRMLNRVVRQAHGVSLLASPLKSFHTASASSCKIKDMSSEGKVGQDDSNKCQSSNKLLSCVPRVDIDPSGVFKYILLKVHDPMQDLVNITIVRGYQRHNYHSDIYDEVQERLKPLDCEPLGGGRISHEPDNKKIHIYGYSQGYGKADHEVTAHLIKKAYPEYTITVSDEGY